MYRFFKNKKTGFTEATDNEMIIAQFEKYPEYYEEAKNPVATTASKPAKKATKLRKASRNAKK